MIVFIPVSPIPGVLPPERWASGAHLPGLRYRVRTRLVAYHDWGAPPSSPDAGNGQDTDRDDDGRDNQGDHSAGSAAGFGEVEERSVGRRTCPGPSARAPQGGDGGDGGHQVGRGRRCDGPSTPPPVQVGAFLCPPPRCGTVEHQLLHFGSVVQPSTPKFAPPATPLFTSPRRLSSVARLPSEGSSANSSASLLTCYKWAAAPSPLLCRPSHLRTGGPRSPMPSFGRGQRRLGHQPTGGPTSLMSSYARPLARRPALSRLREGPRS